MELCGKNFSGGPFFLNHGCGFEVRTGSSTGNHQGSHVKDRIYLCLDSYTGTPVYRLTPDESTCDTGLERELLGDVQGSTSPGGH